MPRNRCDEIVILIDHALADYEREMTAERARVGEADDVATRRTARHVLDTGQPPRSSWERKWW